MAHATPTDILLIIFSCTLRKHGLAHLLRVRCVCRRWNQVITEHMVPRLPHEELIREISYWLPSSRSNVLQAGDNAALIAEMRDKVMELLTGIKNVQARANSKIAESRLRFSDRLHPDAGTGVRKRERKGSLAVESIKKLRSDRRREYHSVVSDDARIVVRRLKDTITQIREVFCG